MRIKKAPLCPICDTPMRLANIPLLGGQWECACGLRIGQYDQHIQAQRRYHNTVLHWILWILYALLCGLAFCHYEFIYLLFGIGMVTKSSDKMYPDSRDMVFIDEADGATWSCRTGDVVLADGTEYRAILHFCDTDQGEHYVTMLWIKDELVDQSHASFEAKLGKTKKEIFPYKYKADIPVPGDIHLDEEGWG